MICNTILDAIGNTPIIRLNKLTDDTMAEILVKFEGLNVGGSIKTRTAEAMVAQAEAQGIVTKDTIIVEPTSGNQGIGLALAGAVRGIRVVIVMPDSVSAERRKLVTQYGAELVLVHDDGDIGACIRECVETAMRMKRENPKVWVPQQFENPANPAIQKDVTGAEILRQVEGKKIDGFCSGIGTGGTLSGIGAALREANPETLIWAIEPEHAAILAFGRTGTHLQMGIGDGLIPDNLYQEIYDDICIIQDDEALEVSRQLARQEGILCGITAGTNVAAALKMAKILGPGKTIVTILPDTGERYFSTELFLEK